MNDLDTLRPEVREAVQELGGKAYPGSRTHEHWLTIRAELRRLAGERDELRTAYTSASQSRDYWKECAGRAGSDLAALKAKIADAPIASVRVDDRMHVSIGARSCAVDFVPLHTKRVRLVVEE